MGEEKRAVTYYDKVDTECPCCGHTFKIEKMFTGGGRVIAGEITDELRRMYQESKKYGYVNPLIYPPIVCPNCWYAVLQTDFNKPDKETSLALARAENDRISKASKLFDGMGLDFKIERSLETGAAAYILCVMCYSFFNPKQSPSIKRGICALRAAWLCGDIEEKYKTGKFSYYQEYFYKKAHKYYNDAIDYAMTGKEPLDGVFLGPDNDKDYGYDGVVYLNALLNFKLGPFFEKEPMKLGQVYLKCRTSMAKLFGFGRSSKEKPSSILETARGLYDEINSEIERIENELGEKINLV